MELLPNHEYNVICDRLLSVFLKNDNFDINKHELNKLKNDRILSLSSFFHNVKWDNFTNSYI